MRTSESWLALVLLLIGWKGGASFLNQSHSVVNAKPITFWHSNENRSINQKHSILITVAASAQARATLCSVHKFYTISKGHLLHLLFSDWGFYFSLKKLFTLLNYTAMPQNKNQPIVNILIKRSSREEIQVREMEGKFIKTKESLNEKRRTTVYLIVIFKT